VLAAAPAGGVGVVALAAAKLAVEGGVAAAIPVPATAFGAACDDGSSGAAVRAATEVSTGVLSRFHQAHCGPDWQPATPAKASATTVKVTTDRLMSLLPRLYATGIRAI
jgi:hypothetical protein